MGPGDGAGDKFGVGQGVVPSTGVGAGVPWMGVGQGDPNGVP